MIPSIHYAQFGIGKAAYTTSAVFDPSPLPDATVGTPYTAQVDASGGIPPYTYAVTTGALPAGVSLNAGTGEITGTPTTAATGVSFTVTVTDSEGNFDDVTDTMDVAVASIDVTTVFKAHTYTGNGVDPRTLTGIDLSGGGVFLLKIQLWHQAVLGWSDGTTGYWVLPESNVYTPAGISSRFVAGGYQWSASDVPAPNANHSSAPNYVIETFKKAASFADVVHYSGTGSAQNISHSLGKVPAMILVKRRSGGGGPITAYHVGLGNNAFLNFDSDGGGGSGPAYWDATDPSATVFRVGTGVNTNESGYLYSAMLFAHDPTGVIQGCSWTGDGTANGPIIDLGWEPQFILTIPNAVSIARNIYDTARDPGFSSGRRQPFAPPGSQQNVSDFTLYNSGGVIGFRVHHTDANGLNVNGRNYYALVVREP